MKPDMEFKGKEEYQDIVLQLMKYVGFIAIDNPKKFPHAIEVVRDYMEIWGEDDQLFQEAISMKATEEAIKRIPGEDKSFKVAKHKLREIVKLFGRGGFIEAKRIEGVISERTLDIINECSKDSAK